jgi:hypothetical protein
MPMQQHALSFKGYWREPNRAGIPTQRGIFCVYSCTFDPEQKTVTIHRLLYVGAAENARDEIAQHPKWQEWKSFLQSSSELLCFTFAQVVQGDLESISDALISQSKPASIHLIPAWREQPTISVSGAAALLTPKGPSPLK